MKSCLLFIALFAHTMIKAQKPDYIYASNIKTVKMYMYGNPLAYPIISLNSGERLELHFDDMDANVKSYSYTYQLCTADWQPALMSQFDYIKGFSQQRINTYRMSAIAYTRYTHYMAILPESNCAPSRAGNYLVKVFLNGDTSKLAFTRRLLVLNEQAVIAAQIQRPFNGQYFNTHQKVNFIINTSKLNIVNAMQQVKVYILQNNRWDNAIHNIKPTFIRPKDIEYNTEQDCLFPAGKEWRWLDLRSFRLQSDRVQKADYSNTATNIVVVPDKDRSAQRFVFFKDNNGKYFTETTETINPFWEADYATVNFTFVPPGNVPYPDKDVYLFGELSNYGMDESSKMKFNEATGNYETSLFLKQGYYDYSYITTNQNDRYPTASFQFTEGNYWEAENNYTILVYFQGLGDRADQLVGITRINSITSRPGN